MPSWFPEQGYHGFDISVSPRLVAEIEQRQTESWREWYAENFPEFEVRSFEILGNTQDGLYNPLRELHWRLFVRDRANAERSAALEGTISSQLMTKESRRIPRSDSDVLDNLELYLDSGPGGAWAEEEMAEVFEQEDSDG